MTLTSLLRNKSGFATLTEKEWDEVIPQARSGGLLARLALSARLLEGSVELPQRPRYHLEAALVLAEKHRRDVLYELDRIREVIGERVGTIVLLKGAAYLAAELPPSAGRTFNDIDILVPEEAVAAAEALFRLAGWRHDEIHPYDDRYYRRWMHQIPPLTHGGRQSTIDVHHRIVPRTARAGLASSRLLMQRIEPLADRPGFAVLAPEDMILHAATHLFNEGEFARGLRDLDDLNQLLRHFGREAQFWQTLAERARELDLARPLYYALRYTRELLDTPIPPDAIATLETVAPSAPLRGLMDMLFYRALRSPHPDSADAFTRPALWLLYVRAHYLRMPLRLLVPHLLRKAIRPPTPPRPAFAP